MSGNHFDQIAHEIRKQKRLMEKLEAENCELRQQIADLRSGRGIFVDIYRARFALRDTSSLGQTTSDSSVPASASALTSTVAPSTSAATFPSSQQLVDAPTAEMAGITTQTLEQGVEEPMVPSNNDGEKQSLDGEPTFLEEIMIDEFASVLTTPNAVWQDPAEKQQSKQQGKPQELINDKQKEALRRELTGSFLLE